MKDVIEMKAEMPVSEYRKFVQANVQVEVTTESKNMQEDQCVEDLKLVELLRHIIGE